MSLFSTVFVPRNTLCRVVRLSQNFNKLERFTTTQNCHKNEDISMNIFDRNSKNLQRERAASATDANVYDYLKDEIGYRLADRVFDIKRKFKLAADIGKALTEHFYRKF